MPEAPPLPPTQYRQGGHALLADGRTAALLDAHGNISWLCWPRVDSDPVVLGILDRRLGGWFQVRPARRSTAPVEHGYLGPTLGVRTTWRSRTGGRLNVDDALAVPGPPRVLRLLRAVGEEIEVDVHFLPAFGAATLTPSWELHGGRVVASAGGLRLSVDAPGTWTIDATGAHARLTVAPGPPTAVVLSGAEEPLPAPAAVRLLDGTLAHWGAIAARMRVDGAAQGLVGRILGPDEAVQLVVRSGLTICALRQSAPGHGIVAAPTTSLPQFLGGALTWDYRYSWPRDTALAGMALVRLGLIEEASALGSFCGEVCRGGEAPALVRVDGTAPPPEIALDHLAGHDGGWPVRIGNAAASQAQLDVTGEVIDLAHALARAGALPEPLRAAVPALAALAVRRWQEPDHGIWEIRGEPHCYTHSRVMAWTALRRAAALARRGAVAGDPVAWERTAEGIRASILEPVVDPQYGLPLIVAEYGVDAANALVPLAGFLPPDDPLTLATLQGIASVLGAGPGLVQRHSAVLDGSIPAPCAPFIFATFWLASAFELCRGARARRLATHHARAALRERSPLGLFGEVSLPKNGPMGNYPQVQSHASLILAALPRQGGQGGRPPGDGRV